jgi:hypothetical protein
MLRSTKITIGIVLFLLICLIVGITLYFVLRKKSSSSSPDNSRQDLINLLQNLNETKDDFLEKKLLIDVDASRTINLDKDSDVKKQMIERLSSSYQSLLIKMIDFIRTSQNKINGLIDGNDALSPSDKYYYSQLKEKINIAIDDWENLLRNLQKSGAYEDLFVFSKQNANTILIYMSQMLSFYD